MLIQGEQPVVLCRVHAPNREPEQPAGRVVGPPLRWVERLVQPQKPNPRRLRKALRRHQRLPVVNRVVDSNHLILAEIRGMNEYGLPKRGQRLMGNAAIHQNGLAAGFHGVPHGMYGLAGFRLLQSDTLHLAAHRVGFQP